MKPHKIKQKYIILKMIIQDKPVHIKHVQEYQSNLWQKICSKRAANTSICLERQMHA